MSRANVLAARRESYGVFEIVAWPALVWCAIESTIRVVAFRGDGVAVPGFMAFCAAAMIAAARARRA